MKEVYRRKRLLNPRKLQRNRGGGEIKKQAWIFLTWSSIPIILRNVFLEKIISWMNDLEGRLLGKYCLLSSLFSLPHFSVQAPFPSPSICLFLLSFHFHWLLSSTFPSPLLCLISPSSQNSELIEASKWIHFGLWLIGLERTLTLTFHHPFFLSPHQNQTTKSQQ